MVKKKKKKRKKGALVRRQANNVGTTSYERLVDVCLFADVEPILRVFYDVFVYSFVVLVSAPSEASIPGKGGGGPLGKLQESNFMSVTFFCSKIVNKGSK